MIEQIRECQKCNLCINQKPLLDTEKECQIFWVGLSAKKMLTDGELPLSPATNTGMIIHKIEEHPHPLSVLLHEQFVAAKSLISDLQ